jgi:integrase/recombinase XerD
MTLFESVRDYVDRKRKGGFKYVKSASILYGFCKQAGDVPLASITPRQVEAFLTGPRTSATTWRSKYGLLKNFFEFWAARGALQALPMPSIRPPCLQKFIPHIYTRSELRDLLRATRSSQKRLACLIESRTLRTLLLFLYGTGAHTGEALNLQNENVDLKKDLLTIRGRRFNRVRCIPIGSDLHKVLMAYARFTARKKTKNANFFVTRDGHEVNVVTLAKTFQRLRRVAGITGPDELSHRPRMHDLRHTFATHRLTAWIKQGADLSRMLPALAAYMGQVGLGSTERYLSMTPERFRRQLLLLSPQRRKKRWRDNAALMKFLSEL